MTASRLKIAIPDERGSARMRRVRRIHTGPELQVRRTLHKLGYRYRLHVRGLPGTPDLVFKSRKRVIFVHGCFWHRHPNCPKASMPRNNRPFWEDKFRANIQRDQRKETELRNAGWEVLIVWECETRDAQSMFNKLTEFLGPPRFKPERS
jgi:DNA mismatch endonuclease, patch repair protein